MLFQPKHIIPKDGLYIIDTNASATAHRSLDSGVIREFWQGFTFTYSRLDMRSCDEYIFALGNAEKLPLDGYAYSINITGSGVCVNAADRPGLMQGFMTLLDRITAMDIGDTPCAVLECCEIKDFPSIRNRMAHLCVFPETELYEIRRLFRLFAALKYTHVVIEFWGMLKYDCMAELAWPNAYTKEQIRPLICEANELGLEIIPMFNHWGHASAGRVMHGKHVVLDQNPALQTYFSEDGWCWDISKPKVRALLKQIRSELIELCGPGNYFHIGCDEAYNFSFTQENMDFFCDFMNGVSADLTSCGRRAIAWGDMFLYGYPEYESRNRYACNTPSPETEKYLLAHLSRDIMIADWQYESPIAPVETAKVFRDAGFDCLLCPWDRGLNETYACMQTVTETGLTGYIHTTWHTLSSGTPYAAIAAVCGYDGSCSYRSANANVHTATLLRKVFFVNGDYRKAGWAKRQINVIT